MHWVFLQTCAVALESPFEKALSNFARAQIRIMLDRQRPTRREVTERVVEIEAMLDDTERSRAVADLERDTGMEYDFILDQDWEAYQRRQEENRTFGAAYDLLLGDVDE